MAIPQTYEYDMERALRMARQRSALSGTTMGGPETSRIVSGVMAPHIQQYAQRVGMAQEREMRQQRWKKTHKLAEKRFDAEKETAEWAGRAQWAQLGLYGMHVAQPHMQPAMSAFDQWYSGWTANRQQQQPLAYSQDPDEWSMYSY